MSPQSPSTSRSKQSPSTSRSSDESEQPSRLDQLRTAAGHLRDARRDITETETEIRGNKQTIDQLRREVREDESELLGKRRKEQKADEQVRALLADLEKQYGLRIERVQASGPVTQGGKATFRAVHDELPPGVFRLSWNTGGCPFDEGADDTITVDTSAVAPGDYDISVSLDLALELSGASSQATASALA
jgi:hypothetical protein